MTLSARAKAPRASELAVDRMIAGRWHLKELLGQGGLGAVYAARGPGGEGVAVKLLHPEFALLPEQRRRFEREAVATRRVPHPGVAQVLDAGVDAEDNCYLVLERFWGRSVDQLLSGPEGRGVPFAQAQDIVSKALDVMVAAHATGVLHRDLKPSNLFLTNAGELKVLDFGIAKVFRLNEGSLQTRSGTLMGTPGFMSPEQARGAWDLVDERTDVWALGVTLFILLSGRLPFEASHPNEVLGLSMVTPALRLNRVLPDVSSSLAFVVDRALEFDRKKRWRTVSEMREALASAELSGGPRSASTTTVSPVGASPANATLDALTLGQERAPLAVRGGSNPSGGKCPRVVHLARDENNSYGSWNGILVVFGFGPPGADDAEQYAHWIQEAASQPAGRRSMITVISPGSTPDVGARRRIVAAFSQHASRLAAAAFVVQAQGFAAAAQRGVISGIILATGLRERLTVTSNLEAGTSWLGAKVRTEADSPDFEAQLLTAVRQFCETESEWHRSQVAR